MISYERPDGRLLVREVADTYDVSETLINELIRNGVLDVVWSSWYNGRARWIDEQRARDVLTARGHVELPPERRRQRSRWTHPDGLTTSEIAELLRIGKPRVRLLLREGEARFFEETCRGGVAKYFPVEEIERIFGKLDVH